MTKPKKPALTDDDIAAFREAMRGVKPLVHDKKVKLGHVSHEPLKKKRQNEIEDPKNTFMFSDFESLPAVSSDDQLEFARSGIQYKVWHKLRKGQYKVEAILDLHRKTVDEARDALNDFLVQCQQRGLRHVLIIHGKGRFSDQPILKNKLNHWLRQTGYVLAFCSAVVKHGGRGAVSVLLKAGKVE